MPFTHVEIEQRKTRSITRLFGALVLLDAAAILWLAWVARWGVVLYRLSSRGEIVAPHLTASWVIGVAMLSFLVGAGHWIWSTRRLLDQMLEAVGARPLDPRDSYHAVLANIVAEVSIATGGKPIEPHVISSTAVNACAAMDFDGRAAIAVTEGALAVLTRAQLESVVGHEAAHIVSGDSLTSSVFCALFALPEEALKRLGGFLEPEEEGWFPSLGREAVFLVVIAVVLWVVQQTKIACEVLISREREYRADAIAVRLTRNPLSLAEALRTMSKRWRGIGARGESLGSIFIVDPGTDWFSEQDGLMADLFSTHPPIERRIELLLGMAHLDPARFEQEMGAVLSRARPRTSPDPSTLQETSTPRWMVWRRDAWAGPFGLAEMTRAPDVLPETWVRRLESPATKPAYWDPALLSMFRTRYATPGAEAPSRGECPNCRVGLTTILYEGSPIEQCPACKGCYVDPQTMAKVFAREEYRFSDEVKRLGDALLALKKPTGSGATRRAPWRRPLDRRCPRCGAVVLRKFYTEAYPVEVEQCWECGLTWLDRHELELLQYLYEQRRDLDDFLNEDTTRPPIVRE